MKTGNDKPDEQGGDAQVKPSVDELEKPKEYDPWEDGFRVSMFLLLVIGLPLFLASLYFVLYVIFGR